MADFADSTAVGLDVELLAPIAAGRLSPALPVGEQLLDANLYAVCDLVAGRAARASSARQYRAIYTRFCDALRDELGRPPVVADVTVDAIAAYSRAQERHGGRGGGPASPATRRVHLMMLRALLTQLGLDEGRRRDPRALAPPRAAGDADGGAVRKPHPRARQTHTRRQARPRAAATARRLRAAQRRAAVPHGACDPPAARQQHAPPPLRAWQG
jgi:hypothetical protein